MTLKTGEERVGQRPYRGDYHNPQRHAQNEYEETIEPGAHLPSGITPDIVTVAKGLGGGIPIGACIAIDESASLLEPGNHGTTFGGNPVATAAALAVLDTIEADGILAHVNEIGAVLREGLAPHRKISDVTGRGLILGVVLDGVDAAAVSRAAREAGIIVNAPTSDRLRLVPPLVLTRDQAQEAVTGLLAAIDEVDQP